MQLRERLQAAGIDYRPTRPVGRVLPRSGLYALTFRLLRLVKDEIVELVTPKSRLRNLHMEYTRFTGGKWALEPGFWVTGSPIWSGRVRSGQWPRVKVWSGSNYATNCCNPVVPYTRSYVYRTKYVCVYTRIRGRTNKIRIYALPLFILADKMSATKTVVGHLSIKTRRASGRVLGGWAWLTSIMPAVIGWPLKNVGLTCSSARCRRQIPPTFFFGVGYKCRRNSYTRIFVCLFAWGLTALSAQIGYITP